MVIALLFIFTIMFNVEHTLVYKHQSYLIIRVYINCQGGLFASDRQGLSAGLPGSVDLFSLLCCKYIFLFSIMCCE